MTDHTRFRELAAGEADGILTPDESVELALHLRGCTTCRAEVHAFARDQAALAALPPVAVSPRVAARVQRAQRGGTSIRWPLLATAVLVAGLGASALLVGGPRDDDRSLPSGPEPTPTVAPAAALNTIRYREPELVATIERPAGLSLADIDSDGDDDLAVGSTLDSGQLVILLGDGAGGFGGRTTVPLHGILAHQLNDLDGDGELDIVGIQRNDGSVAVRYGEGRVGFGPAERIVVGMAPAGTRLMDVDGDGRTDIVTANQGSDDLSVVLATGPRTFSAATSIASGDGPAIMASGDFDLDGALDLAVGTRGTPGVTVHWGSGDGGFTSQRVIEGTFDPADIATGDVDGDDTIDLVVSNRSIGTLSVLTTRPAGPFWRESVMAVPHAGLDRPTDLEVVDLDGDERPEIVAANGDHDEVLIWPNDGAGAFLAPIVLAVAGRPLNLEVRDIDLDGRLDVIVSTAAAGRVSVLFAE